MAEERYVNTAIILIDQKRRRINHKPNATEPQRGGISGPLDKSGQPKLTFLWEVGVKGVLRCCNGALLHCCTVAMQQCCNKLARERRKLLASP